MITFGSDVADLILRNTLLNSSLGLNTSIEQMTTGYKVNHAKDNAAGYSIITELTKKISSTLQVQSNTDNGLSMLLTAEGGLEEMEKLLQRLRSLAVQASTGSYDETSRAGMQAEADEIIEQIAQIRENMKYNGLHLYYTEKNTTQIGTTAISRLASAVHLSNSNITNGSNANNDDKSIYPTPIFTSTLEDASQTTTSSNVFSSTIQPTETATTSQNTSPVLMSTTTSDSGVSLLSDTIDGAVSLGVAETQNVTIDGVEYTVKNRVSYRNDLSYIKDTTTGELTFIGSHFEIRAQDDVSHNIIISGRNNYIYGGNLDDTISELDATSCGGNFIYAGSGNDKIVVYSAYAHGEEGDDTFNMYGGTAYGEAGNDIFNMNGGNAHGGDGNDIFNLYKAGTFNGNDGDDTFNILATFIGATIDGGTGTNTVTGTVGNNTTINVVGANSGSVSLVKGVEQVVNINGIDYTMSTTSNTATLIYKLNSSGQIEFSMTSNTAIIKGDENKSHNVLVNGSITFYGGNQGDNITAKSGVKIYCGSGNNTIKATHGNKIYCQYGNNTITCDRESFIYGGSGSNSVTITGGSNYIESCSGVMNLTLKGSNNTIYGTGGNNVLISDTGKNNFITGFGDSDNAQGVSLAKGETKNILINGVNYTVQNRDSNNTSAILYSINAITGIVSFSGSSVSVTGQSDVAHNVKVYGCSLIFYGSALNDNIDLSGGIYNKAYGNGGDDVLINSSSNSTLYGGDGDDTIITNTNAGIYGEDGNDTITVNATNGWSIKGGLGNDTYNINATVTDLTDEGGDNIYNINASGVNISGGSGADTFYISGDNNTVLGAGGNDYFVIDGNDNTIDGGTGTNYYINNGTGTNITNTTQDPNAGGLSFSYLGEVKTFSLNGKTYTVTNNLSGNNLLQYSLNPNTGVITITGSDLKIDASTNEKAFLNIRGDNNIVTGSNLADRITVEQGSNNTIKGGSGDDTIIMNSENNSIDGGDGNDTITLNATTNLAVTGGSCADIININSDNNTNINSGSGNDTINIDGENNIVNSEDGNNKIYVNEDNNVIKAGNGDNRITILSSDNTVTAGSGNNILGIEGDRNNVTAQKVYGNINIYGSQNTVFNTRGENKVNIKGDENSYSTAQGSKDITVNGNSNEILTGAQDDTINIIGSENTIETTGGDNEIIVKGDTNQIQTSDGDDTIEINGNENIIATPDGNNEISIKGNSNQVQGGAGVDEIKINGNDNIALGGAMSDSFMVSGGNNNTIDGELGDRNTLIDNGSNTISTNVVDITPRPFEVNIKVGIGSGADKYISTSISFNLFDFGVDFSDIESSIESLESIDTLLKEVTEQLLNIGSTINRLESAAEAQSISLENMISSLSTIRDADIAEVSSDYIRNQILQNAAVTLIDANRNLRKENVLALINSVNLR